MNAETTHPKMVKALAKSGADIVTQMSADTAHLLHMGVGVSGESGELLDAIKKHAIYGKDLDLENVMEELGDLEFYLEGIRAALNITRVEVLVHNINKLSKRYKSGSYSDKEAIERADKSD